MTYQVSCNEDLGIEGCDFVASGESPADVLEELLPHLRSAHNLSMPDADTILDGYVREDPFVNGEAAGPVETVVRRLQRALELDEPAPAPTNEPVPVLGRLPNR